jgi:hypothetical protein
MNSSTTSPIHSLAEKRNAIVARFRDVKTDAEGNSLENELFAIEDSMAVAPIVSREDAVMLLELAMVGLLGEDPEVDLASRELNDLRMYRSVLSWLGANEAKQAA